MLSAILLLTFGNQSLMLTWQISTQVVSIYQVGLISLPYEESKNLSLLSNKVLLICWQIWNDKNNVIFRKTKPHPTKVPLLAVAVGMDFLR